MEKTVATKSADSEAAATSNEEAVAKFFGVKPTKFVDDCEFEL